MAFVFLVALAAVTVPTTTGTSKITTQTSTVPPSISDGSLRLVNGTFPFDGRLEVYHNGQWGTVCDDYFDTNAAAVACKQLGYLTPPYSQVLKAAYGVGTGKIWLDDVVCNGSETSLTQCNHTTWAGGNCGHYEDVGLTCDTRSRMRLVNGWKSSEGRVEVYHNGQWGTVCGQFYFDAEEASVICKTLGYSSGKVAPVPYNTASQYGEGSGRVWLSDVNCNGNEGSFFDCQRVTWSDSSCNHYYDAGVDCSPGSIGNASIKLYDGWKKSEGRVEVYYKGKRGTVCDDNFGATEAAVVCTMLGYSGKKAVPKPGAYFGQGSGQIVLDNLDCQGTESSIFLCQHSTFGTSNCYHDQDVGVDCDPENREERLDKTDLRLVGGSRPSEGRLELFHSGEWGTICDFSGNWDTAAATVVCSMLGYNGVAAGARGNAYYGQGSGRIWFSNVKCQGNETHLLSCFHRSGSGCGHYNDVGVDCRPDLDGNVTTIRLVNGGRPSAGRVEVFHSGQWGTVCDTNFGKEEATVICKMMGFPGPFASRIGANYGEGTGRIWLDSVFCLANETNFFACSHSIWGSSNCYHSRDAGVDCDTRLEGNASTVRLVGGMKMSEGRVEVLHNGQWGTVCDYYFTQTNARVICQMLGFNGTYPSYKTRAYYGQGTGPEWLYNVRCTGSELNFFECSHNGWGKNTCGHYHDVGVDCDPGRSAPSITLSDFRLVNGTAPTQGRLEVYHDGEWGSVCMTDWDARDAKVVCKMLNLTNGLKAKARTDAYFGESPGPVWIDNIECYGTESNLLSCYHYYTWGQRGCDHRYDVGVDCAPGSDGNSSTIRLVNGTRPSQGRLEVLHNGEWGTVCNDNFDIVDAQAACRTLGYSGNWVQLNESFGEGSGRIWLDEMDCAYGDSNIFACNHESWGRTDCSHGEDVGIDCKPELDGNRTTIRLVNGSKSANGRLEVFHDGNWGTVCNHGWDDTATKIACKTLGYKKAYFTHSTNRYGQGNGTSQLDDFSCLGNESSIFECQHGDWGHASCDSSEEVGIECDPDLNLRLVDGPDKYSGRVEVKVNGTWGTVCSEPYGVTYTEADVICKMLGNRRGGSVAYSGTFPAGTGPIHLSYLSCRANDYSIFQCSHGSYRYCTHSYDVGVRCRKGCLYDSDCDNNATCLADNTCQCQRGWIGQYCDVYVGPNGDCRIPNACPRNSVCVPGKTSHVVCVCISGYEMHGLKCVDINECQRGHACPDFSTCHNTDGGYTCDCFTGYKYHGLRCVDEDECQDPMTQACPSSTVCENLAGSYECRCASGYKQDGLFCTDVDECQLTLCPPGAHCTNTPGAYKCYTPNGFLYQDIDECQNSTICPQQHANCINAPGNYTCTCLNGFVMNRNGPSCDDINECSGNFTCPAHSHCVNEIGDYSCACDSGYREQSFQCRQITS